MAVKPSKPDVRAMAKLLDQDHDNVETLAQAVLALAFELYEHHDDHGLLFHQDGVWFVYRGFPTALQADKWATKQGLEPGQAVLVTSRPYDKEE